MHPNPTPPLPHDNRPPALRMPAVDFATADSLRAVAARRAQLLREERALRHTASERAATRACVERKLEELAGKEGVRA